jgi:micrococcal nuclease
MKSRALVLSLLLALLLTSCRSSLPGGLTIEVVQVSSGRQVEVAGPAEITEHVRLEGIDVPDVAQSPWGETARSWLEAAIAHRPVLLESDVQPRDGEGQRLAYLWQDGVLLNERLVAEGHGIVLPHVPNRKYDDRLSHAQDRARVLGLGIWNPDRPMRQSPADFRNQRRE